MQMIQMLNVHVKKSPVVYWGFTGGWRKVTVSKTVVFKVGFGTPLS